MRPLLPPLLDTVRILAIVFRLMVVVELAELKGGRGIRRVLTPRRSLQYVIASALGAIPGCVDAFLVVSFYKAGLVGFGALAAVMLSTAGDEAFVMLATIPRTALWIFGLCLVVGIAGGAVADGLVGRLRLRLCESCPAQVHAADEAGFGWRHFLIEHVYGHILRKHLVSLFLWLFLTLLALRIADQHITLEALLPANQLLLVVLAALVGLVPESGPHLAFVLLFAKGLIPFSVLAASSVAQDGHGVLPLLAYSVKDAVYVKVFAAVVGLIIGLILMGLGL
ncbi:MAG: arsenic efflux protein [Armatimonadota bacterium]|nr:MAG: arsenic efflux protein [Armatimonadota bacterium]